MKRVVIASDSFKGSLSSLQVADNLEIGILDVFPDARVIKLAVADGGEGTVEAIMSSMSGRWQPCETVDPLGRKISTEYAICGNLAIIETASASGLTLLAPEERNPSVSSSFGTGLQIRDALDRGCRDFVIGLGGSATNDAGTGILCALGAVLRDSHGCRLCGCGNSLHSIAEVDLSGMHHAVAESGWTVICDVDSPFCGPRGTAYVFAPQKGADAAMVASLDSGLSNFADVIRKSTGRDVRDLPGAGAAGGIGGMLAAVFGAQLRPGVDVVLDLIEFDEAVRGADLVITGEGRMDSQTACGKTPAGVLHRAQKQGIPAIAFAGRVESCPELEAMGFRRIIEVSDRNIPVEQAMKPEVTGLRLREKIRELLQSMPDPSTWS